MKSKLQLSAAIAASVLMSQGSAQAQAAAAPEQKGWETLASAGLIVQSGNSESVASSISLDTKKKWESDEVMLGVSGGYGKSSSSGNNRSRTTDFAKAYGQYNHLINERAYFGLRVDGERDGISDLAYRVRISPLVGYYVIKNDLTTLSFDFGPTFIVEEREATAIAPVNHQEFFALRFGEKFEHKLSDTTKIWQSAEYIPALKDWPDHDLINAEIGISTAITPKWDLQIKYQVTYDNGVDFPKEGTDTRLIAGTTYKF
jgi:putative salt-induced outer membrane protein YdiY